MDGYNYIQTHIEKIFWKCEDSIFQASQKIPRYLHIEKYITLDIFPIFNDFENG